MRRRCFSRLWIRKAFQTKATHGQLFLSGILGLCLALFFIHQFDTAVRPRLITLAQSQLRNQIVHIAETAVTNTLTSQNLSYSDLVIRQGGAEGEITTFSTDTVRLNHLRASILTEVTQHIESLDLHAIQIPLGSLTGIDLFSASGPWLPIQLVSVSSAEGNYRNEFTDAGINQSVYRVMLDISVTVNLLLPGGIAEATVSTPVCVAETLIIGQVPQTYLNWTP